MSQIALIAAIDNAGGIGVKNTLPWKLPEDLAFFKKTTSGHPVIMGRKTFDSIGRPLPNRRNIVVTRNRNWRHPEVEVFFSLEEAIFSVNPNRAFILGGADIFEQALPHAQELILTEIDHTFECDAFFPPYEKSEWILTWREEHYSESNGWTYAFSTYKRLT